MSFVLDASVAIAGLSPDEADDGCVALMQRCIRDGAVVPAIWSYEIVHILARKARLASISEAMREEILELLLAAPIVHRPQDLAMLAGTLPPLMDRHGLTGYDAAYLRLAIDEGLPLATRDRDLARAAEAERVAVI